MNPESIAVPESTETHATAVPSPAPRARFALIQPLRKRDFRFGAIVVAAALAGLVAGIPSKMTDEPAA